MSFRNYDPEGPGPDFDDVEAESEARWDHADSQADDHRDDHED